MQQTSPLPIAAKKSFTTWTFSYVLIEISISLTSDRVSLSATAFTPPLFFRLLTTRSALCIRPAPTLHRRGDLYR